MKLKFPFLQDSGFRYSDEAVTDEFGIASGLPHLPGQNLRVYLLNFYSYMSLLYSNEVVSSEFSIASELPH